MSPDSFQYLLNAVGPAIKKKDPKFRKAMSQAERLRLTIHYLETVNSRCLFRIELEDQLYQA